MSKITRPDLDVVAFGSQSQSGERTVFGDEGTVSDDLTVNINSDFIRGWAAGLDPVNGFPSMEFFNGQIFTVSQLVSYLFQMGISEWNANQFYPENALVLSPLGAIKQAVSDNTGNDPDTEPEWTNPNVGSSGVQSITGNGIDNTDPVNPVTKVSDSLTLNDSNTLASAKAIFDVNTWASNDARAKTALNAAGSAGIYACRAWVNIDGTGTVNIRGSGNVSSVTDNGVGNYTVNFTVPMQDANYAAAAMGSEVAGQIAASLKKDLGGTWSTTAARLLHAGTTIVDADYATVAFMR